MVPTLGLILLCHVCNLLLSQGSKHSNSQGYWEGFQPCRQPGTRGLKGHTRGQCYAELWMLMLIRWMVGEFLLRYLSSSPLIFLCKSLCIVLVVPQQLAELPVEKCKWNMLLLEISSGTIHYGMCWPPCFQFHAFSFYLSSVHFNSRSEPYVCKKLDSQIFMQTVFRWCIPLQVQATPRGYLMASCSKSTHQTLSRITGVWKSRRGGLITEHISEPTSIPTTSKRTAEKSCSIWPAHWADCVGCGAGWRLGVHCHCRCNNLGSNRWVFWSGAEQRHYTRNATPTTSRNKSVLSNLLSNASNDTVCLSQFLYTSPVGSKDSDAYLQWIWTNELFNSSKMVLYLSSTILFSVLWEFMLK